MVEAVSLRIKLLGGFAVWIDDRQIDARAWRLQKAQHLVKLLALAPDHRMLREQLMELLWPDLLPEAAANNLYGALHQARELLRPAGTAAGNGTSPLRFHRQVLLLEPSRTLEIDVDAFIASAAAARTAPSTMSLEAAISLYTGDLLPEDRYQDWATGPRETLRETYLDLLANIAQRYEHEARLPAAIDALQRILRTEQANEAAHVSLIQLFMSNGQRHEALRQYTQLREALRRELDAEPEEASEQLYLAILQDQTPARSLAGRAALPASTPPAGNVPNNLPLTLTSFIGRSRELEEIGQLFQTTRLLTLVGAGGSGKTRLVLEFARALAQGAAALFPDGVWFVELAALTDPALVPRAVAGVLGLREDPSQSLTHTLSAALATRKLLLVLDNCEHLLEACGTLAHTLLSGCAGLRVLATSREALRIPGECSWYVPALSLPSEERISQPTATVALARLQESEAVRLFVERARSVLPAFVLTPAIGSEVARICRRLDGTPLAIELAAARVRLLAPAQISARLDDCFRLLSTGSRTALPRHQTLRAAIDWSHDLLASEEQAVFRQLAIFPGDWAVEAAETICAGGPSLDGDVLDILGRLVDKSLVVVDFRPDGFARYRLLETMRQYGRERLLHSGEFETVAARHAAYYCALAKTAATNLRTHEQIRVLEQLEREHDNLRAALRWALDHSDGATAGDLTTAIWRFWEAHNYLSEGLQWMEAALELLSPTDRSETNLRLRIGVLGGAAVLLSDQGDGHRALAMLDECLALSRELDDKHAVAMTLSHIGAVAWFETDYPRMQAAGNEALSIFMELGDRSGVARMLSGLGLLALVWRGDKDAAVEYLEQSLQIYRELREPQAIALTLIQLAATVMKRGNYIRSGLLYHEATTRFAELHANWGIAYCLEGLATLAIAPMAQPGSPLPTEYDAVAMAMRAARLWGAAMALREAIKFPRSRVDNAQYAPYLEAIHQAIPDDIWQTRYAEGYGWSAEQAVAEGLGVRAPFPG